MGYFETIFNIEGQGEHRVHCPFHHDDNASASVNLDKRLFSCQSCEIGMNEVQFIQKYEGITYANAIRWNNLFKTGETAIEWKRSTIYNDEAKSICQSYNIADAVAINLGVTSTAAGSISFPVFYKNHLMDIRTYTPNARPKMKSRAGSPTGLLIPAELDKSKVIILCAGEKDMATTRSKGFNAYTITGGEMGLPANPAWFKDAMVVICYDNDDAGKKGAENLANYLYPYTKWIKVCTAFHEICSEDKEDLTDFWNKYGCSARQLMDYIKATPDFVQTTSTSNSKGLQKKSLAEASSVDWVNKLIKTDIQVIGTYDQTFIIPTSFSVEKVEEVGSDRMLIGQVKEWELRDDNLRDILLLCDGSLTDDNVYRNMLYLAGCCPSEKGVRIHKEGHAVVTKATINDVCNLSADDSVAVEYTCYIIGDKVESGKKYTITHKLVTHPSRGQQLVSIANAAIPAEDSITTFTVTDEVRSHLRSFQNAYINGDTKLDTIRKTVNEFAEKVKTLLGYNGNNQLITTIDLAFHTPLYFNFGAFKNVRAYLDTLIVGESRVGKSSTADCLRKTYGLGAFVSLAGNSATVPALIGGTLKQSNGQGCTKAGVIPQNHKGLVIFEEFGKCDKNITGELTDIRSSNEVRIQRVSGSLTLPAVVRMITLSNVKPTSNGDIRSIESYPNGIAVATELVPTAEDIARYDMLLISADKGNANIDPRWQPPAAFTEAEYRDRIRWIWSRTADQIVFTAEAEDAIVDCSNYLNKQYDCHIKLFGTECWKKLCRISIAVAGYLCSADEQFNNIIVEKDHVIYASEILTNLYDNDTFRLREYVRNERKYIECDDNAVKQLQEIYIACPQLLNFLEENASATKSDLDTVIGLSKDETTGFQSVLVRGSFITLHGTTWMPTVRFRKGMRLINRETSLERLHE